MFCLAGAKLSAAGSNLVWVEASFDWLLAQINTGQAAKCKGALFFGHRFQTIALLFAPFPRAPTLPRFTTVSALDGPESCIFGRDCWPKRNELAQWHSP